MNPSSQPNVAHSQTKVTRPVLRYHGGKWKLAPWIISHFPKHRIYVEPFGGSASILVHKKRSETEIYNEIDAEVYNLFVVLRDARIARRLAWLLARTPFSRTEYKRSYQISRSAVERARRLIVRSCMGQSSKGIWSTSGFDTRINDDGYVSRVNTFAAMPDIVRAFLYRLRHVVVENLPAIKLIPQFDRKDCLLYCDPPYVPSTRTARVFRHDMSEVEHRELAGLLQSTRSMVIISGYPCDLYDKELYPTWKRIERAHLADGARKRTEVIWLNAACVAGLRQGNLFA